MDLLDRFLANEALTQDETYSLLAIHSLSAEDVLKIATWKFNLDDDYGDMPDFQREIFLACLKQVAINEEIVGAILEHVFADVSDPDEAEPYDVLPYWWEVFELTLKIGKVSTENLERIVSTYLLFDYVEDEVEPEMQLRLLKLAESFTELDSDLLAEIADKTEELTSLISEN
jgi:hypothetical protein